MPVQTATCQLCRSGLNPKGECVGCLLRVGLGAPCDPEGSTDPRRLFGDFEIACREDGSPWELGRGGMGVTYRAMDTVLHRAVALKVIGLPDGVAQSPPVRERFLREARSAASLHHPNVAEVFQFGASPETDQVYYAMELIDGETLEDRVRREGPLGVDTALEIAVQVARALAAAADRGLVHRDVKPGNIMLSPPGALTTLRATVIDFGLARAMTPAKNAARSTHGGFVGTPAFASPEQFRGEPADARSDIYALGATLWFALTGSAPFTGETVDELRDHPARAALPLGQLRARKVPDPLVNVLRSTLALDPAARPASARELLAALEACRCARVGRAMGIAMAVAALATVAVIWWAYRRPSSVPGTVTDKSVAVLPFDNFSEDKDNAFFTEGVQDEVLTDLSKVADLKVISRSSVMQYRKRDARDLKAIGKTLGVAFVVEGSVQRAGNKIKVAVQLIDARTDTHRWAEEYVRDLSDVFAIQSEIARAVASQLQAVISPQEHAAMEEIPTRDEAAYLLYLRALARWNDWDTFMSDEHPINTETMGLLQQATARDPGFARAFAFMADVQTGIYGDDPTPANAAACLEYAETVARLRPGSADAYLAMGFYDDTVRRDFARAHDDFAAALRQSPNDARAHYCLGQVERRGHWDEALLHLRRATELDPENTNYLVDYGHALYALGHFQETLALADRRIASHPTQYWLHAHKVHTILAWKGDTRVARAELALLPPGADPGGVTTYHWLELDVLDRDFVAAARDLAACPLAAIFGTPRVIYEGDFARHRGDDRAAEAAYTAARPMVEAQAREHPKDAYQFYLLAKLDALLGHKEAALDEGRRMVSLESADDPLQGPASTYYWARLLTFVGERDEAIRALQTICGKPYTFGFFTSGPQYGYLHLDPDWDPLRGDPRFEAMVAALAPKP